MNKLFKGIALVAVVGIIGVLALGAIAFAQGPDSNSNPNGADYGQNFGRGWMHNPETAPDNYGSGEMMQRGNYGGMTGGFMNHDEMHADMAEALGMTVEELDAAMAEGKTMVDIAADQGVEWADVRTAMDTARQTAFDQAEEDGTLPQYQSGRTGQRGRSGMRGANGSASCGGYAQSETAQ